jgi:hypothetical protein
VCACKADLLEYANELAAFKRMDPFDCLVGLNWQTLMTQKMQSNLFAYEMQAVVDPRYVEANVLIANLQQTCAVRATMMEYVPSLLTSSSTLYLVKANDDSSHASELPDPSAFVSKCRIMIPKEHLAVMGWPIFAEKPHNLQDALPYLSSREMCHLAGNGFCLPKIGKYVFWMLACTNRINLASD